MLVTLQASYLARLLTLFELLWISFAALLQAFLAAPIIVLPQL
jgi:hypothetical protein